jgi:hypothetical protein
MITRLYISTIVSSIIYMNLILKQKHGQLVHLTGTHITQAVVEQKRLNAERWQVMGVSS